MLAYRVIEVHGILATANHGLNSLAILLDGAEEVLNPGGGPVRTVVRGNRWAPEVRDDVEGRFEGNGAIVKQRRKEIGANLPL